MATIIYDRDAFGSTFVFYGNHVKLLDDMANLRIGFE
jgi:hypothetical protein